eukprot:g3420.t1
MMLGTRSSKVREARCDFGSIEANLCAGNGGGGSQGSEVAEDEQVRGGDESSVLEHAGNRCATGVGGDGAGLSSLVASLVGLELEEVFRTVVGFV